MIRKSAKRFSEKVMLKQWQCGSPILGRIGLTVIQHNERAKEKLWRPRGRIEAPALSPQFGAGHQ
jgi:hypothetical protein